MKPLTSCVTPEPPTSTVNNVDDYKYNYLTEALTSYPNCYTTEWDELFKNIKAPLCDDIFSYFFNPTKPLLPLDTPIPYQPQNIINVGDNEDSYKLVYDESNKQFIVVIISTPPTDSSVKQRKRVRRKNAQGVTNESDVAAPSSLETSQAANAAPNKKKNLPKSSSRKSQ
ncbi:hypothetical protein MtrunA17_Chr8g0370081 [Medicago truncatula]|uniref:Uncharacterized protein n=1 Tax=Medicago truncatula TaxID=3880 RepID=G7L8L9_MEDTR|nr:hypothetical protein MTR_8g072860 [Medicago truncatula]RHN41815.1 hypothetical protein MtrunA17_Chr8g0370081 [Medicago truncatula]